MSHILEINGLDLNLPVPGGTLHAIRNLDLNVAAGETLCIVGESGSGKSLTALSLMGLLPQTAKLDAGKMAFLDQNLMALNNRAYADMRGNRMSMIFQEPMTSLNPCYTIGNQLMEVYLRHNGPDKTKARNRALELLHEVGIAAADARLSQYPHQLSGGLRQRVMIAMALMCEPDLIIADEPTTALDVTIQAQVLSLLDNLRRKHDTAIIFITHDLGVVARIATRVAVMYAGQIVEIAPVEQLFENPSHPYTRGLIDCIPVPGKTDKNAPLISIPGEVPDLSKAQPGCAFASRCPKAKSDCLEAVKNIAISKSHDCRCNHPNYVKGA